MKFLMVPNESMKNLDDNNLTHIDKEIIKLKKNGAMFIWELLYKKTVRKNWEDHKGYPIKREFYNKQLLACSVSIRKLCKESGCSKKKIIKSLKQLEVIGIIKKDTNKMNKNQNTYTLGTWFSKKELVNNEMINKHYEKLYLHEIQLITTDKDNGNFDNLNFSEIDMYQDLQP